ncbi:MAG: type 1 glutamine amidotransferase domain-containing protein [Halobacteriales archaeon]
MQAIILATDGFEDSELIYPYYRLQEDGADVHLVAPEAGEIEGTHGYTFEVDWTVDERRPSEWAESFDLLVIPGGTSPEALRTEAPLAADIVAAFDAVEKPIAAICHGAQLLISADVLEGREVTGYWSLAVDIENAGATYVDESVVVDDHLVTSRVPSDLPAFMTATFEQLETTTVPA